MDIKQYMEAFKKYLQVLPSGEAQEIYTYYEEFFLDSGKTVEEIKQEYGSPKSFARTVVAENLVNSGRDALEADIPEIPASKVRMGWLIFLGILASPVLFPLAIALLVMLFAAFIVGGSLLFAFAAVLFALGAAGVGLIIGGFQMLFYAFASGILSIGSGLIILGVLFLLIPLLLKLGRVLFRGIYRLIESTGRKAFKRPQGGKSHV